MRGDRRRHSFLTAIAVLAVGLSALAFFGGWAWQIDMLAQFRFQALLAAIALLVVAAMLRARVAALAIVAAIALNAYALLSVPVAAQPPAGAPSLRIAAFNLLGDNRRIDDVVAWLREQQFDLVSFEELTPAFAAQMDSLADLYPYRLMQPSKGGFGIGIISRHPLLTQETLFPERPWRRVLRVSVDFGGTPIEVLALHPPPPLMASFAVEHDDTLDSVAALPPNPHRIVMGDFNAALTSLALRRLCARLELAEAGIMPRLTWPTNSFWPLQIPIDHILVGKGLALGQIENGPALGSDHFPQIAAVTINR
jgi:endonuclease/exonuclease/phosphatase (EEP) superfamily protein YafD